MLIQIKMKQSSTSNGLVNTNMEQNWKYSFAEDVINSAGRSKQILTLKSSMVPTEFIHIQIPVSYSISMLYNCHLCNQSLEMTFNIIP
jgi:hypothetical protein